jgi:thioredoxin 1
MPVRYIGSDDWGALVESSKEPVLVEFVTSTCPVCAIMAPVIERLSEKLKGEVRVYRVDVGREQALAMRFGVQGVPTFMAFCKGRSVASMVGEVYPTLLERMAKETLEFGGACASKQTKVKYEISGYG